VRVDVAVTANAVVPDGLPGATVLVVDVLRASTTIVTALANGCAAIVPVADADEARRRARRHAGPGPALVAGERRGDMIAGFDLGNSPLEFSPARVRGATVFLTTSNGTRALLAARPARAVGVAGLVNVGAAAAWAAGEGGDVVVICAGERGAPSLEDAVCAGLLVDRLLQAKRAAVATAAAAATVERARPYGKDVGRLREDSSWARHLVAAGRAEDVAVCLALDTTTLVPVYLAAVDKVVRTR
jgi:2-phosphosulfolactate phosphatase